MDNIQFWIALISIVIYLISRAKKKGSEDSGYPEQPPRPGRQSRFDTKSETSSRPKQLTFEELLREISEAKGQPAPKQTYVDYDDDLQDEEQDLEDVNQDFRDSESFKVFEKAKEEAFARPSLEDLSPRYEDVKYERFKEFEGVATSNFLTDYVKELKDPNGFKKAIVMSEILNRKHF